MTPRMDDFVSKIVTDPKNPPHTLLLKGFIGASSEEGHVRLYFDSELSDYIEIPEAAILHSQEVPKEKSPIGGSYVWIQRDAVLIHGPVVAERPKASFLQGRIMQAAAAAAPFLPQTITGPLCNTIIDGCTDSGPRCPSQVTCPAPCPPHTLTGTTCPAPMCPPPTQNGPNCPTTPLFTCSGPNCPTTPDATCCGPNCPTFPANTCGGPRCPTVSGTTCPAPCPPPPTRTGTTCPAPCPRPTQIGPNCPVTSVGPHCVTVNDPGCPFPTEVGHTCVAPCHQP